MKTQKVLVTGGAGFIGSHLVEALLSRGFQVKVIDNMTNGSSKNLQSSLQNQKFKLVQGDLKDPDVALKNMDDIELVFHFAANPDVRSGEIDPTIHFNENLLVTFNILEAMRRSLQAKLIVFSSSSTIYGEADELPTPEDYGPLFPISIYGASKLGCESMISSYCHTFDMRGIILRFANIVGFRATHGVLIDFVRKLKRNSSELEILGDGKQTKSYLHIEDLIKAISIVLDDFLNRSETVEAYNVGSADQVTVKRIAEVVCEEMGIVFPKFTFKSTTRSGGGWKGDVKTMQLSIDKISDLGWKPSFSSEEAIKKGCKELLGSA